MQKYLQIVFLFSKGLKHPQSSKEYFTRFCEKEGFLHEIQEDIENLTVRKGTVYIAIKQQDVVKVVKQGRLAGLKCGKDFGLLAYNDIPSYEVIDEGITSLSIDWEWWEMKRQTSYSTMSRYKSTCLLKCDFESHSDFFCRTISTAQHRCYLLNKKIKKP